MAYTSVIPVYRLDNAVRYAQDKQKTTRQHGMPLAETVDYALNREKTETDGFESGLGCTTQSAYEDMRANAVRWHKTDGVQGYHLVQSFAEGEVTPELAHKIGLELAERVLGGRYQAIVTTHLNTSHYHNHIVWSSVAMNSGRKYHSNAKSYALEIRAVSDELCVKYGLSIIQTERAAQVSKPYAEWLAEKNGQPTWRTVIRQDVDAALAEALTWRQFIRELESKGYELNFNHKYPTLRPPGKTRPVRFKTLGRQYTSEALQIRILYPDARWHFLQEQPPVAKHARLRKSYGKARRLTGLRALYYRYLYELGALPHTGEAELVADVQKGQSQPVPEKETIETEHGAVSFAVGESEEQFNMDFTPAPKQSDLETTALGRKNPSEPSSPNKGPLPDTPSPRADKIRANGQRPSVRRELGDIRVFLRQRDDARAQLPRMPVKIKRMERTR